MSRARDRADGVLHNRTHEDTDGGRESLITFKGEQSGGEISTLAQIQASHDGTADDEKSDLIFKTNDGSDGASPTEAARIDSDQNLLVSKTSAGAATAGFETRSSGYTAITRDGGQPLEVRRLTSDGDLIDFRKDSTSVGTIGVENGDLNIDGGSGHVGIRFQASSILPRYNGADANGNMDLGYDDGTGTHRWRNLYLSGGINFGLASASNVSTETLDDYEEGTWTPTLEYTSSGATQPTISSTSNFTYIKIGAMVFISGYMNITNKGSGSSTRVAGLPYAGNANYQMAPFWSAQASSPIGGYISSGVTFIQLGLLGGSSGGVTSTNLPTEISIQHVYRTT